MCPDAEELAVYGFREQDRLLRSQRAALGVAARSPTRAPARRATRGSSRWDDPPRSVWVDSQGSSLGGDTGLPRPRGAGPRAGELGGVRDRDRRGRRTTSRNVVGESVADYGISGRVVAAACSPSTTARRRARARARRRTSASARRPRTCAASALRARRAADRRRRSRRATPRSCSTTMVVGLEPGQPVALRGELLDLPGVIGDEILVLEDVVHAGGFTTLVLEERLERSYVRKTVTLNANVVAATHGETVRGEILGGGDGVAGQPALHAQAARRSPTSRRRPRAAREHARGARRRRAAGTRRPCSYGLGPREPALRRAPRRRRRGLDRDLRRRRAGRAAADRHREHRGARTAPGIGSPGSSAPSA